MKILSSTVIAILLLSFAGCATETQTTTTTSTTQRTSTTDTTALERSRSSNMESTGYSPMGPR